MKEPSYREKLEDIFSYVKIKNGVFCAGESQSSALTTIATADCDEESVWESLYFRLKKTFPDLFENATE